MGTQSGSSPLARGLLEDVDTLPLDIRIIPARAGFTHQRVAGNVYGEDHPRSRGVYYTVNSVGLLYMGSSPLARGLLPPSCVIHATVGIIPARAGFTLPLRFSRVLVGDHPRSRGVYRLEISTETLKAGSSPLARGLRGK